MYVYLVVCLLAYVFVRASVCAWSACVGGLSRENAEEDGR